MGRPTRTTPGGYVYHVLNRANARATLFAKDKDYAAFLRVLAETQQQQPLQVNGVVRPGRCRVRLALLACGMLVGIGIAFYLGWEYGRFHALHSESERRYEEDRKLADPVLAGDPAFRRVVTINFPVPGFCLAGPVETRDDYDRLRAQMARLFGETRIGHVMQDVIVEPAAAPDRPRD